MRHKTLKNLIIPTLVALTFASHASALNYKGKFKKKTHKISGTWALVEVEGHQVINFGKKFKTEDASDLVIILSKKSIRSHKKNPTFEAALKLATLKSNIGTQYYIVPASIDLSEYESILIHSETSNVLWGGFDIPNENAFDDDDRFFNDSFEDSSFDDDGGGDSSGS